MVTAVNSTALLEVEGEIFTLRLNFAAIERAEDAGIDILGGQVQLAGSKVVKLLHCLLGEDHPDLSRDQAMALVMNHSEAVGAAIAALFERYGSTKAKPDAAAKATPTGEREAA